ncbi:hypothetical protein JXR93_12030 [bacterium]|nr:hypothetical protein [bacterium]
MFLTSFIILSIEISTIFNNISSLYREHKYNEAILNIETILEDSDIVLKNSQLLTELLFQYRKISYKIDLDPTIFFKKLVDLDCNYTLKERVFYELAQYYKEKGLSNYYSAIFWYKQIVKSGNHKSVLLDDAYWNLFLIYKEIGAYNNALLMLQEIINTEESSYLIGSYNLFYFYDAFIEKAKIELLMNDLKSAKSTLNYYINNYPNTDTTKKAKDLLKNISK